MNYLSLFDGIGAACVAWEPLGWKCVGVSEIEPFPMAVTQHHRPHVPHLGDVTKITEEQVAALGRIDLIVGGFPCQDVSVAGKRAGLRNEDGSATRSGLFFDAMRIVRVARERCGLRWLLVENVPGLFSSNAGRDFAAVVGAMVGTEFDVPRDGWRNAGFAAGPEGLCEWATLDAQFFNVAQRRARVFALADFGDWTRRPPILLEPESLRGDPAPSREAGQSVAGSLAARTRGGDGLGTDFDCDGGLIAAPHAELSPALKARDSKGPSSDGDGDGAILVPMVAPTLQAGGNSTGGDVHEECSPTLRAQRTGGGGMPAVMQPYTLAIRGRGDSHDLEYRQDGTANALLTPNSGRGGIGVGAIAFDTTQITSAGNYSNPKPGDACHPLAAGAHAPAIAFAHQAGGTQTTLGYDPEIGTAPTLAKHQTPAVHAGMQVRRLVPTECEALQGFPRNYTRIAWRGKPAEQCPDGPRYRALGNSFAVPVVAWIGRRIAAVHALALDAGKVAA